MNSTVSGAAPEIGLAANAASGASGGGSSLPAVVELRSVLEVDESTADEVVLVAAVQRIRNLEGVEELRRAEECVSRAMSAGTLTSAQRDWALGLARRDPGAFAEWESSAPVVVPLGRMSVSVGVDGPPGQRSVEMSARAEWRANRGFLERICTEEAYAASAVRECAAQR